MEVVCKFISKETDSHIYGIDIVEQVETGDYYLIDMNYFPGYKNLTNIRELIHDYILKVLEK